MSELIYDESNQQSIIKYAQLLEKSCIDYTNLNNGTFKGVKTNIEVIEEEIKNKKGGFGQYLETAYFGKEADNKSQPDFPLASIELKSSPLKTLSNGTVKVKERLVLNHFTYNELDKEDFNTSHFKYKNEHILIVFYHYNKEVSVGKMTIQLADLWECIKEDEFQIRQDWLTIYNKVHNGKAHELSESDTVYLGACTKGATKETNWQTQPHSNEKAQGRAFCFKLCYINHIFNILTQRKEHREIIEKRLCEPNQTLIEKVNLIFSPYIHKNAVEICKLRNEQYNPNDKSRYANLARRIMGFNKDFSNIYEFNAGDIQFKTIRVEPNGKCIESMSFKNIDYDGIIDEEWEESYLYSAITSKFIIVLFKRDNVNDEYYLDRIIEWKIPQKDYEQFKLIWEDTKQKVLNDDYDHFLKISDNPVTHIRPKGKNASDLYHTLSGKNVKKMCYWINQKYVQENILDKIYKLK